MGIKNTVRDAITPMNRASEVRLEKFQDATKDAERLFNLTLLFSMGVIMVLDHYELISNSILTYLTLSQMIIFVYWIFRLKKNVCIAYGMRCKKCGKTPWPSEADKAVVAATCPRCSTAYEFRHVN